MLKALNDEGYSTPTPIQQQAIPIILERKDLLGCAQTGTGKTAAFALPLLQLLAEDAAQLTDGHRGGPRPIRALILTPTRELAIQIDESFAAYGRHTGSKHLVIFGGVPQQLQVAGLQRGTDILVATPGRLLDLCDQKLLDLRHIKYFVLDEADRMLDMGFINDVRKILTKLPAKKHSLFFSATMPPEIQKLAGSILVNPSKVEVTPVSSTADTIQQYLYFVDKKDKRSLLLHILKDDTVPTALVFTRTKHGADKVAQGLTRAGIRAEAIHGNKSQNARQRALVNFKNRHTRILVATDIAARGIDIDDLTHVINFELPNVPETYVHRIGRTGRAGASGTALSFCDGEEKEFLRDIQKLISRQIPVVEDHPHVMYGGLSVDAVPSVASAASHPARHNGGNNRNPGGGRGKGQQGNGQQQGNGRQRQADGQRNNPAAGGGRNNAHGGRPPKREQPAEQQLEPMPGESIGGKRAEDAQAALNTGGDQVQQSQQDGRVANQQAAGRGRGHNGNQSQGANQNNGDGQGRGNQNQSGGHGRGRGGNQGHGGNQGRGVSQGNAGNQSNGGSQSSAGNQSSAGDQSNGGGQGHGGNQPEGRRGAGPQKPPRKNAGELKMPEQGKAYKDPLEGLGLKIKRDDGDEKW
ncbi:MAG TPA: DEAD/DEAH box helicase [Puia sp.]|nr:DEAD/DEAH box helicase [Puia sp.]